MPLRFLAVWSRNLLLVFCHIMRKKSKSPNPTYNIHIKRENWLSRFFCSLLVFLPSQCHGVILCSMSLYCKWCCSSVVCLRCSYSVIFIHFFFFFYFWWLILWVARISFLMFSFIIAFYIVTNFQSCILELLLYCHYLKFCLLLCTVQGVSDIFCTLFWPQALESQRLQSDWLCTLTCIWSFPETDVLLYCK